jgi:hypothetical protein
MTFATAGCRWISKISNGIREPVMIAVNHSAQRFASHRPTPSVRNSAA